MYLRRLDLSIYGVIVFKDIVIAILIEMHFRESVSIMRFDGHSPE